MAKVVSHPSSPKPEDCAVEARLPSSVGRVPEMLGEAPAPTAWGCQRLVCECAIGSYSRIPKQFATKHTPSMSRPIRSSCFGFWGVKDCKDATEKSSGGCCKIWSSGVHAVLSYALSRTVQRDLPTF